MHAIDVAEAGELHADQGGQVQDEESFRVADRLINAGRGGGVVRPDERVRPDEMDAGLGARLFGIDKEHQTAQIATLKTQGTHNPGDMRLVVPLDEQIHVLRRARGRRIDPGHPGRNRVAPADRISDAGGIQCRGNLAEAAFNTLHSHDEIVIAGGHDQV